MEKPSIMLTGFLNRALVDLSNLSLIMAKSNARETRDLDERWLLKESDA